MRPIVDNGHVGLVLDPVLDFALTVFCVGVLLVGMLGRKYLRPMGELPHMRALLWGARWFGPLIVAAVVLHLLAQWLGVVYTGYAFTVLALSRAALIVLILLPILLLPMQSDGWVLGLLVVLDALRFRPRNYRNWIIERRAQGGRSSSEWVVLAVLLVGPMVAAAGVARNAWQADLESQRISVISHARESVEHALADLPHMQVSVVQPSEGGPLKILVRAEDDADDQTLEQIAEAARHAMAAGRWAGAGEVSVVTHDMQVADAVRAPLPEDQVEGVTATRGTGDRKPTVTIVAVEGTDETAAAALADGARGALAAMGVGDRWQVEVEVGQGPDGTRAIPEDLINPLADPGLQGHHP